MARNRSIWIRLFVLFLLVAVISCGSKDHELLENMGDMRRHTAKLGYSIQAKNGPLAEFYLEEILEIMEELREIEAYEGIPVAKSVRTILDPTVPLARHLFAAPTQYYKVGVVFLAWLNGHQSHFRMIGGLQGQRSLEHLVTLAGLAAGGSKGLWS